MTWISAEPNGVCLRLHIQPNARKTEVVGMHGDALKIRLAAPPAAGKANDCLIAFLAERLGVTKANIEIVSGLSSRAKRAKVLTVTEARAKASLTG